MAAILVIGGASSDILHCAGQTVASTGGAGMYTAMAAQRSGVQAALFAPRPSPLPEMLQAVAARLASWLGPLVTPAELPHFEIAHHGGETTYLQASFGAELDLAPGSLPPDLSMYDCIHIIPLGDAQRQLSFLQACRQRGAKRISAGTYLDGVREEPEAVRAVMDQADVFFLNENEAIAMFGSVEAARTRPGKFLFVTLGERGASVIQGSFATAIPGVPSATLDPTGAGDTFCGATLAHLMQGEHPVMAARAAMPLAAEMTEHIGPTALFWPEAPPAFPPDERVVVNETQVKRVAPLLANLPEVVPFPFTGSEYPPVGHPAALDFFFAATLQQFSFWTAARGRYDHPLIAPISGKTLKGSDYLWQAYLNRLAHDPAFYAPARQADLTQRDMLALFRADDGSDPLPALELHLEQAQQYGRDMLALDLTPIDVVRQAQASALPLETLVRLLDHIGGYKEDPLRKKTGLLAMILNQRPEAFLAFGPNEQVAPVIDYHLLRSCLRMGLIDVVDGALRKNLVDRRVLAPADEWAVRSAAYVAIEQVAAHSGKSAGAVDGWFFSNARRRCPEMTEPLCARCPVDPVCAHRKELFQPVLRTTFY
jgi:sugar/nucleoside kinase (ribokinase family)